MGREAAHHHPMDTNHKHRRTASAVLAAALMLGACSSGPDTKEPAADKDVDAVNEVLAAVTAEMGDCLCLELEAHHRVCQLQTQGPFSDDACGDALDEIFERQCDRNPDGMGCR